MESTVRQDSIETRERIVDAAEKLFSEKGFSATSVRDITAEAGSNVAAVNYHFGGKENLYLETFRSLLAVVRDRRIAAMSRDMESEPEMDLAGFIESFANAFMEPLVDESRGRLFMGFFAHEMIDPRLPPHLVFEEFIRPLITISVQGLNRYGPQMEPVAQRLCLMSIVGQLMHTMKAREHIFRGHETAALVPAELGDHIRHIVRFSVGGIQACAAAVETRVEEVAS